MDILLVTDIHGDHDSLERILEREEHDAVLCAGDIGDAGSYSDYEENLETILDVFDEYARMTKAVPGNMDNEQTCVSALREHRMNLHRKLASFEAFDAIGFGGGITPFGTPFEPSEAEIAEALRGLRKRAKADKVVAVVHQPPKNSKTDVSKGSHVGSQAVRDAIEETDLDLFVTGHIHESRAVDDIGGSKVVNPGPVRDGYYAVAQIAEERIDIELRSL